jgi:uncharacterized surface protein with fasciclin (FAS1) repeats
VVVNGATVTTADVLTSNGIIHVIDTVLSPTDTPNDIPATAGCTGVHDSLVAAVVQADLLTTLQGDGPFTLFAPTDQAFTDAGIDLAALDTVEGKAALTEILLSHVVAGSVPASAVSDCMNAETVSGHTLSFSVGTNVMVNGATVTTADVMTSNGIIHVIDTVLTPTNAYNDITQAATCTGIHTSLVAALVQAELAETLQGEGPYTVFAPTDQAFADAGIDLAALNTEEGKATLTDILLFHVYAGTVASTDITEGMKLRMLNGDDAVLSPTKGIEGANITLADVQTSNGVIHVVDMVLTPVAGGDEGNDGAGTSGSSDEGGNDWVLYIGIAVIVAIVAGLIVVRLTRRNGEDLESIQALGQNEPMAAQPTSDATAYATTAAGYNTQATAQPDYQQAYQQSYQPAAAQPVAAAAIDTSLLSAFEDNEPAQTLTAGQQTQAVAVAEPVQVAAVAQPTQAVALPAAEPVQATVQPAAVQPVAAQPAVAQPVVAAEPKVVNQWSDDNGHTWRVMSDGTNRWWNGTAWQKV